MSPINHHFVELLGSTKRVILFRSIKLMARWQRNFQEVRHPIKRMFWCGSLSTSSHFHVLMTLEIDAQLDDEDVVSDDDAKDDDTDGGLAKDKLIKQKVKKAPAKPRVKKAKVEESD